MPALTNDRTCIVIGDRIPATQREIIRCMILQVIMILDNVSVMDFYDNDKLENFLGLPEEVEIIKVMDSFTCTDWSSSFVHFQTILSHYRNVILVNSPVFRFKKKEPEYYIKKYEEKATIDNMYEFEKRTDIHTQVMRSLFVKAMAKSFTGKNVYQFVINPREVDFRKVWDFRVYERIGPAKWENTRLGPTYEYALSSIYIQNIDKVQDVYWYACSENKPSVIDTNILLGRCVNKRFSKSEMINPVKGEFGCFDRTHTKENGVSQDQYYYNLMLSRYTIITETDDGSFPIVRFMESVILGCIPLLQRDLDKDLSQVVLTDKRFYDIIRYRDLRLPDVRCDDVSNGGESLMGKVQKRLRYKYGEELDVIEELRTAKYYLAMTSREQVEKYYTSMISGIRRTS